MGAAYGHPHGFRGGGALPLADAAAALPAPPPRAARRAAAGRAVAGARVWGAECGTLPRIGRPGRRRPTRGPPAPAARRAALAGRGLGARTWGAWAGMGSPGSAAPWPGQAGERDVSPRARCGPLQGREKELRG